MPVYVPPLLESFLRYRHSYYQTIFISRPHNMRILERILSAHADWFRDTTLIYDAEALFAGRELTLRSLNADVVPQHEAKQILEEELAHARLRHIVTSVTESEQQQLDET